jgi:arginyl-tRNA synthetase
MTTSHVFSLSPLRHALDALLRAAISEATGLPAADCDPVLALAKNHNFGDYQSNAMMGLAKKLGKNPRELAVIVEKALVTNPDFSRLLARVEVAGPGFLNLSLADSALTERLASGELAKPRALPEEQRQTVVVDYSSPNIAKEMHVGHIRSTILGDAIARILEFLGHRVVRQNHLGDWGTQFGMLVAYFSRFPEKLDSAGLSDVEENYRQANDLFKSDPAFEAAARQAVVSLHQGEPEALALWERVVALSKRHLHSNYQKLGVGLRPEHDRGESFYNPMLATVVGDLLAKFGTPEGRAEVRVDDGAVCVYLKDENGQPLYKNKDDEPFPFLIQKSDGAFLYATTDLAALRYRVQELGADWIIIVTDNRQAQQIEMMFATAKLTGLDRKDSEAPPVRLQHITFGTILGPDRRPLKTRDGGSVKLSTLVDEAVERAAEQVTEIATEGDLSKEQVAEKIGVGAIKYADLAQNRQTDYLFTWDKLLSMKGNTAPYFSFAYARCCSILRKSGETEFGGDLRLEDPHERALALQLCRFPEVLETLPTDWQINFWTDYLYGLASSCMLFLENCRVLNADDEALKRSRLRLCAETATALKTGLGLLGIELVDRM